MICSNCGTENRAGRKFCSRCATPLVIVCSRCQAQNEPGELFCGDCAAPLDAPAGSPDDTQPATRSAAKTPSAPAPVAERRLVSILFADLVGFTTLAEGRDAEETRDLLSRYFDLARDVIGRYGGTVEKFIGDAVMAVWGAPTAHEDDAERAVRAALELLDEVRTLGPSIQARSGVLTGEAAVTLGATNQGMVAGDLVNTASRLQSVALPGTVLVGEATQRAAAAAIVFEPAGEQALKGKTSQVPAWRAVRVVAERGERLLASVDEMLDRITNPFQRGHHLKVRSLVALAANQLDTAFDLASRAARESREMLHRGARQAGFAAVCKRDESGVRRALDLLEEWPGGTQGQADRLTLFGAAAALAGRSDEALIAYRRALGLWRELGLPWNEALCAIGAATVLEPSHPDIRAAAGSARDILTRLQARPFLELLDAALARDDHATARSRQPEPEGTAST